jgi:hypothetical protein
LDPFSHAVKRTVVEWCPLTVFDKEVAMPAATVCAVEGCSSPAAFEVILYGFHSDLAGEEVFWEQDVTCPFLCHRHVRENEASAKGEREPRNSMGYKFTNRYLAHGFSIYRPLQPSRGREVVGTRFR